MRIGVAQINPTLGNFQENRKKISDYVHRAKDMKCSLVVFPECSLFGYHPFDLLERKEIVEAQLQEFRKLQKEIPADIAVVVGLITMNPNKRGRPYHNSAALLVKGKKAQFFHKEILPTGDVFDEARFIEPGLLSNNFFTYKGRSFLLTICEDIWGWDLPGRRSPYLVNPLSQLKKRKLDLIINLSASPFFLGKMKLREQMTKATAKHFRAPILYTNLVGAQDEIVFDGQSFLMSPKGQKIFECMAFEEHLNVFDLDSQEVWHQPESLPEMEQLRKALVLGIQDFCRKINLQKIHLGLSGGIDSALVACLAVDALGPSRVKTFALPGPFSAPLSLKLARELARNLGTELFEISIVELYEKSLATFSQAIPHSSFSVVNENLQARLRGLLLMAYGNKEGSLLVSTSNKSEMACGYATLYGDMCGGLAPIADLTKNQVYELANHYNSQTVLIPKEIIERPPTAELRANQKDRDSLPPYPELDEAVVNMVEHQKMARSETEKWLLQKMFQSEFKRWQAPPVIKVSAHSFGRGRRFPVAGSWPL